MRYVREEVEEKFRLSSVFINFDLYSMYSPL